MLGEQIGAWVIEGRLGEGGMGTVYVARHQVMGRRAALKVLRPEHDAKPEMVQRFLNEARAAAAIEHPGIVDVLDVGERADGGAYLVMELLEGESLAHRLRARGRLPAETAVRLARQIAAALGAAHARGIVHRDLKPDNVFVVPDPETTAGERVKLLDFGIAKLHGELAADAPTTRTGAIFGTPLYMSPEQCRGGVAIDHRADLYALGCILYEMVTGRPPFRAPGLGELLSKHMTESPAPPTRHAPDLPAPVEDVILRLLAKAPDQRFASAREVIAALDGRPADERASEAPTMDSFAISETVLAHTTLGDAASEVVAAPPRRRWPLVAGAGLVAAAIAAVAVIASRDADPAREAPAIAIADAAALVEPTLGLRFLADLEAATGSRFMPYSTAGAWESAARDFDVAIRQDHAPPRWRAAAVACAGWAALLRNDASAEESLRAAATIDPTWPVPHLGLSHLIAARGDGDAAAAAAHEAQRLAPSWWLPIAAEARVHRAIGALDESIAHYRRALTLAPEEPVLLSELALVYHAQRLDTEAVRYANDALARDPDMIAARLLLAERALERGDYRTALAEADRVVGSDPRSASGQLARADALAHLDPEAARDAFRKVLEIEAATGQASVPPERLAAIEEALAKGDLPAARGPRSSRDKRQHDRSVKHRSTKPAKPPVDRSPRANNPDDPLIGL